MGIRVKALCETTLKLFLAALTVLSTSHAEGLGSSGMPLKEMAMQMALCKVVANELL